MLQAYVDESGNGDPNFLVLAGYVARSEVWAAFSDAWQSKLDDARIRCFKMKEMRRKPEIAGWFYRTLEDFDITASIACIVNTKELIEVETIVKYPSNVLAAEPVNPYFWAFKYIIFMMSRNQFRIGISEPVDFIFDEKSEKVKIPRAWEIMSKKFGSSDILGSMPVYRKDDETMPLQVADLYAWWVLKWQREQFKDWPRAMPFPWRQKKNINRMAAYFGRSSFLTEASMVLQSIARNSGEMEYAKSLMPADFSTDYQIDTFR